MICTEFLKNINFVNLSINLFCLRKINWIAPRVEVLCGCLRKKGEKTIKLLISQHQLDNISILNSASNTIDHQTAVHFDKAQLDRSIDQIDQILD